ncbi:GNAT family N-acetyltransferase [Streptomyces albogriseolus]|uniref:GNAT family N-acetyltransferase n=1 Tax=Streptomyces albogriseolus TaxID=1887 RepID=UPI0034606781
MPGGETGLPEEGLSLWLTDWKVPTGIHWEGRRVVALVGQAVAGHLDVHVHPDGQAVEVWMLDVQPGFRRRGVASLLMDTLCAVYPTAWINHGARTREGTWWWNGYRDPAPQRNVHDRVAQCHEKAAKALRGVIRAQKDAELAYSQLREAGSVVAQLFRGFTSGTNRAST